MCVCCLFVCLVICFVFFSYVNSSLQIHDFLYNYVQHYASVNTARSQGSLAIRFCFSAAGDQLKFAVPRFVKSFGIKQRSLSTGSCNPGGFLFSSFECAIGALIDFVRYSALERNGTAQTETQSTHRTDSCWVRTKYRAPPSSTPWKRATQQQKNTHLKKRLAHLLETHTHTKTVTSKWTRSRAQVCLWDELLVIVKWFLSGSDCPVSGSHHTHTHKHQTK